jgi:hypothetical protein
MSYRAADIPRTPFAFDTVQFFIPTPVATLMDSLIVRERVTAAGFESRTYEESTHRMPPGKTLITCKRYVAGFIVEHITEIAERSSGQQLFRCVDAATSALDAIAGKIAKR